MKKMIWLWVGLVSVIIGFGIADLLVGPQILQFDQLLSFFQGELDPNLMQIIGEIRLPRVIVPILGGMGLAVAGLLMQRITRNPIASPGVVGIVDGSVLAVTLLSVFAPTLSGQFSWLASLVGAGVAVFVVFGLAARIPDGFSKTKLAIIGVTFSTFVAAVAQVVAMQGNQLQDVSQFFLGGVSFADWMDVFIVLGGVVIALPLAIWVNQSLHVFDISDEALTGLGVNAKRLRQLALLAILIFAATSVAAMGKILFVGLVAPNIALLLHRNYRRHELVTTALLGSALVVGGDLISKFIHYPFETPLAVVITVIGVPFFFYLILRKERGQRA